MEYDPGWRSGNDSIGKRGKAAMRLKRAGGGDVSAFEALGAVQGDDRADWKEAWDLFPGSTAYVWCASLQLHIAAAGIVASGFTLRSLIIWEKPQFAISRGDYHWRHESCWYAVRAGGKSHWQGARDQDTVWRIVSGVGFTTKKDGPDKRSGHSTQKPVECMRRPIVNNSSPGQAVYDPFLGSGTTIIAAETEGRSCLGLEIDPSYCDVIVKRWQEFTGKAATLEGDGRTFAEIETARAAPARKRKKAA